jgi:hypothetical protein
MVLDLVSEKYRWIIRKHLHHLCCDATDTLLREAVHFIALGENQLGQIRYWQSKLTAKMEG